MPTLSTILFVAAFGQPLAYLAGAAGIALAKSLDLGPDAIAYWCSSVGVVFGYMLRANEKPKTTANICEP